MSRWGFFPCWGEDSWGKGGDESVGALQVIFLANSGAHHALSRLLLPQGYKFMHTPLHHVAHVCISIVTN